MKIYSPAYDMSLRSGASALSDRLAVLPRGSLMYGDEVYTMEADNQHANAGDMCLRSQLEIEGGFKPYPAQQKAPVGIPSVLKLHTDKGGVFFTEAWQKYSLELIKMRVAQLNPNAPPASVEMTARKIFRYAYTSDRFQSNNAGSDRNADYINKTNYDSV